MAPSETIARSELLAVAATLEQAEREGYVALVERLNALERSEDADRLQQLTAPRSKQEAPEGHKSAGTAPATAPGERQAQIFATSEWRAPELPRSATLYRALAWATELAGRNFKLYSALAGRARDETARTVAETLAQKELSKAAGLRQARRRAYRAEHRDPLSDTLARARAVRNLEELRTAAREIESRLASLLAVIADSEPGAMPALADTREILKSLNGATLPLATPSKPHGVLLVVNALDDAFAFYDLVQSRAVNEAVMDCAQRLAGRTLDRLHLLRTGE